MTIDDINKLRQDMNVLQEDLINAYQLLEMPIVVDADVKSVIVETDEGGHATTAQRVETQITCRQGWEERPFVIDTINVPLGWTYEVVGGKVIFTISEGAEVRSGQFKIPVIYRPVVAYSQYEDENGNLYVDASDANYMELESSSSEYTYDVWFSYFGLSEGVYLGKITQLQDIPSICNINDYFVWGGADTDSTLSVEGKFKQARCYKFIGLDKAWRWEVDDDVGHGVISMSDVFSIANADLQNNNSQAYEYLDHLTSNSIYTDLLIANNAFINNLTSRVIAVGELVTVGQAENIANEEIDDYATVTGISREYTVIQNGKIVTGLLDANAVWASILTATSATFQNLRVTGNSFFQGLLDCGVLKVEQRTLSRTLFDYAAQSSSASWRDIESRVNSLYNYLSSIGFDNTARNVSTVLSSYNNLKMYYGSEQITTVRIYKLSNYSETHIMIILNGTERCGYWDGNEIESPDYYDKPQTSRFYATYTIGTTVVKLTGLPTSAPTESGLMYIDGNTLKIS